MERTRVSTFDTSVEVRSIVSVVQYLPAHKVPRSLLAPLKYHTRQNGMEGRMKDPLPDHISGEFEKLLYHIVDNKQEGTSTSS